MIARRKMSQNEWKTTEIRGFQKVGPPFSRPGQSNIKIVKDNAPTDDLGTAVAAILGLISLVLFGCICGLAAGPLMAPILELSRKLTMPLETEGLDLDPDEVLLAKAAARGRGKGKDRDEAAAALSAGPQDADFLEELTADLPHAKRPEGGFKDTAAELAWMASKLIQRRGALRRVLSIADVDGNGTIDRAEFLAALPLLHVGDAFSEPVIDVIFADGEITFSSFLEMCVQVVDRDRIRKQFRDASRKLAFLAGVLLPAVTVLIWAGKG